MIRLTIRSIKATGVEVPMNYVLGTSATAVRSAPLLLIDLETEQGVTGRSYLFCYVAAAAPAIARILGEVERVVKGDPVVPQDLWAKLAKRFTLIGVQGIVRMAMAGFDVACWDALAIAAGLPLAPSVEAASRMPSMCDT
jgi:mandelate racemase